MSTPAPPQRAALGLFNRQEAGFLMVEASEAPSRQG
jgi:hypothetical protein